MSSAFSIFQPSAEDQSLYFLGKIFGYMGSVLPASNASLLLGQLFKTFNSIILAVAVFVIIYVTVVGVMKTAHEGEFLGRQWDSLWIPIRTVLGIAALIPTSTGYCGAQLIMMWIIVQGVGAADTIWSTALKYVDQMGSVNASISIPNAGIKLAMKNLFQNIVCQETMNVSSTTTGEAKYYCAKTGNCTSVDYTKLKNYNTTELPIGQSCGKVTMADCTSACNNQTDKKSKIACAACEASHDTVSDAVDTVFIPLAKKLVDTDLAYLQFYSNVTTTIPPAVKAYCQKNGYTDEQCCVPSSSPIGETQNPCTTNIFDTMKPFVDTSYASSSEKAVTQIYYPAFASSGDFVDIATKEYVANIIAKIGQIPQESDLGQIFYDIEKYGWIYAGSFYFDLARKNENNLDSAIPTFNVDVGKGLEDYRNNLTAAGYLTSKARTTSKSSGGDNQGKGGATPDAFEQLPSEAAEATDAVREGVQGIFKSFQETLTGGGNPIVAMQYLGWEMLLALQIIFAVVMILLIVLTIAGYISAFALGNGFINPMGPVLTTLLIFLHPLLLAIMGLLFSIGAMLAVYTPLIPYIIFTVGAIGWFIVTLEAIVAAPIIALAILSPSGHDMLGKAEQAVMLIFNVFLRPSLMILGMMAGMLMSTVVVELINATFTAAVIGISSDWVTPVEVILFLGAYTMLVITALSKCFALIHILPDRVLRWVGGHGGGEGEEQATGEVKRGMESVGSSTGSGMGQIPKGTEQAAGSQRKAKGKWDKRNAAGGNASTSTGPAGGNTPPPPPPPPGGG